MRNEAQDPGFESGVLLHDYRTVGANVTDDTRLVSNAITSSSPQYGDVVSGDWSLRLACSANANGGGANTLLVGVGWHIPALEDEVWSAAVLTGFAEANLKGRLKLQFRDAAFGNLGAAATAAGAGGMGIERLAVVDQVAPVSAAYLLVVCEMLVAGGSNPVGAVTFDELAVAKQATAPDFVSGDGRACRWDGVRFFSASEELGEPESYQLHKDWVPQYLWREPREQEIDS